MLLICIVIVQTIVVTWIQKFWFARWLVLYFQTLKTSYELAFFHCHSVYRGWILKHWGELLWADVCRICRYIVWWSWHIDPHFWICGVLRRFYALLSDWATFVIDINLRCYIDIFNFYSLIANICLTGLLWNAERAGCLLVWILMMRCGSLLRIAS